MNNMKTSIGGAFANHKKPQEQRARAIGQLRRQEKEEHDRNQQELFALMQQIQALIRKDHKHMPAYHRRNQFEDPRSAFYYNMLRRIGLPEIHARFAPWFLKSNQIKLGRWSSMLFARIEQAFFAVPEELSALEMAMRQHQAHYELIMKASKRSSNASSSSAGDSGSSSRGLLPRQQNQLILRRAFSDCSFSDKFNPKGKRRHQRTHEIELTANDAVDLEDFELISLVPKDFGPPGLAPQVHGTLESHGKHLYFTYKGRWKDGEMHGTMGVYTFADGSKYTGEWKASHPNGTGVLVYANGVKYSGHLVNGKFNGYGVMEQENQFRYTGEWKNGMRHGQGKLEMLKYGSVYEGEFFLGQKNGIGSETSALGYWYHGNWEHNRIHGIGTLEFPDKRAVPKQDWPPCVLGEAIRLAKQEIMTAAEQGEAKYRSLLRVRDDLRALDLQYSFWKAEDERVAREEVERVENLKKARREKALALAEAKKEFEEQLQKLADELSEDEEGDMKSGNKRKAKAIAQAKLRAQKEAIEQAEAEGLLEEQILQEALQDEPETDQ